FAVMSHAHGDHDGGAGYLQDTILGMRLVYGAEDWDLVDSRPGRKPKRDMIGTDGQTLSADGGRPQAARRSESLRSRGRIRGALLRGGQLLRRSGEVAGREDLAGGVH